MKFLGIARYIMLDYSVNFLYNVYVFLFFIKFSVLNPIYSGNFWFWRLAVYLSRRKVDYGM